MEKYEPELGQAVFGCPTSEFRCPHFIEAGLQYLACEIERVEWNRRQEEFQSPTRNYSTEYKTDAFEMYAYYWGDDEKLSERPNFKCGDFEIRWYKYAGRGMSMNKEIDANKFFEIMDRCIQSVRKLDVDVLSRAASERQEKAKREGRE